MKYIILIAVLLAAFTALLFWRTSPPPQNLTAFAQCLAEKQATMYGAAWCPHCQNQKQLFGDTWKLVPYVECPENTQQCIDLKINSYPTWLFANDTRLEGEQSLSKLANTSGCTLVQESTTPSSTPTPRSNEKSDNGAGSVTVSASFTTEEKELTFTVELNTHSINLDSFNPATQLYLQDQDKKITPSRIQQEGKGHHRSFTATFSKPKGPVKLIAINLAGVPMRELTW